jgi:hypothetical protein
MPYPTIARRLTIAITIGLIVTIYYYLTTDATLLAADFTWAWRGARLLLVGANPYHDPTIGSGHPYPADAPLFYPLPALLFAIPVALLPAPTAGALFFGIASGLLAFCLTQESYTRLPIFLSLPFWNALQVTQWSPLIAAAVLSAPLLPLALAKPTIGFAAFIARPTRRGLLLSLAVLGVSLVILPTWPNDWWRNVQGTVRPIPLLTLPLGPLLLLAVRYLRNWRGRLLLGMAIAPQFSYDMLPIGLIPTTFVESLGWALLSWGTLICYIWQPRLGPLWYVVWCYLPALAILLRQTKNLSQNPGSA